MTRQPVISSRIKSIGWENQVMEVEFNTGAVYQYTPVSKERYEALASSPAVGKDIQAIINDKTITCDKI